MTICHGPVGGRARAGSATATRGMRPAAPRRRIAVAVAAERVRAAGGAVARTLVDEGDPGPTLVRLAEWLNCDVIVMSTNGRSGWRRAFLGSVSNFVARHAEHAPVLLVHRPATGEDHA